MPRHGAASGMKHLKAALGRRGGAAAGTAVVLTLGGAGIIGYAASAQQVAPSPPAPSLSAPSARVDGETRATDTPAPKDTESSHARYRLPQASAHAPLRASKPTAIRIPAIDVSSPIQPLGLNPDGSVQVPQPGPHYDEAAWYKYSPTPGELGPSVVEGHIDSAASGPSVFFRLGDLRAGDKILVTRADHGVAVFAVNSIRMYPKDHFPTRAIFGHTDHAALRLVSCGGTFDDTTGHYESNIVVYAHLVGSHPASPR